MIHRAIKCQRTIKGFRGDKVKLLKIVYLTRSSGPPVGDKTTNAQISGGSRSIIFFLLFMQENLNFLDTCYDHSKKFEFAQTGH